MYWLFRALWSAALFAFFRRIDVQGRERVPARGPVLIVANHTNAFVDPLLVLTELRRPVSLTAKSTLRGNPLLAVVMRALHVIEFQRSQDRAAGADPRRNVEAFEACRRRLAEGGCIVIFPEGVSHSDAALRPFKTGAARIALEFLEQSPGTALTIVPAGLHYEAKERFRSAAGVVFGEPFDAQVWRRSHPDANARELTAELDRRIRALTANFQDERDVRLFAQGAEILAVTSMPPPPLGWDVPRDYAAEVVIMQRMQDGRAWLARERPEQLAALERRVDALYSELQRLGVSAEELFLSMGAARVALFIVRELELVLVGAPMAAWGALNHALPYLTLQSLVRKMSKDRDHFASNAVFLSLPVVPFFYALQVGLMALLLPPLWVLLYALALPLTGAVALLWRDRTGSAWRRTRTFFRFLRHPAEQRTLRAEAQSIAAEIRSLADQAAPATAVGVPSARP
ncbi:MAG TPA: lysophospholipid acyltransferase family protein [Longimicrobiales bacterium]|nr:lysophospholipid acyltransferase family protein [Longimicrobiales bacterium]